MKTKVVIPAKAGIQVLKLLLKNRLKTWTPAFAGVTTLAFAGGTIFSMPLLAGDKHDTAATQLLKNALNPPAVAYQGHLTVTHWYGTKTRAEEIYVDFRPPDHFRWEFVQPDGTTGLVIVSDGKNERVRLAHKNKVLHGAAVASADKKSLRQSEWGLLQKNYLISLGKPGQVCGRDVWVLNLTPLTPGKPNQQLWVDKKTGVILENKRFHPKGDFVVLSRFTRFNPNPELPDALFRIEGFIEAAHQFEPNFLTLNELKRMTGRASRLPETLPAGFVFESADTFIVDGKPVDHIRYTDGLSTLSVFETASPIRFPPDPEASPAVKSKPGALQMNAMGAVYSTRSGRRHYTLVSDVSENMLQTISAALK